MTMITHVTVLPTMNFDYHDIMDPIIHIDFVYRAFVAACTAYDSLKFVWLCHDARLYGERKVV